MGKAEKRLRVWRENPPVDVPASEVLAVLERYFPEGFHRKTGSHIVVRHELLKQCQEFGAKGEFSIPVSGGQKVKRYYLKTLVKAIDMVEERKGVEA
jgi:hypothetical protein